MLRHFEITEQHWPATVTCKFAFSLKEYVYPFICNSVFHDISDASCCVVSIIPVFTTTLFVSIDVQCEDKPISSLNRSLGKGFNAMPLYL